MTKILAYISMIPAEVVSLIFSPWAGLLTGTVENQLLSGNLEPLSTHKTHLQPETLTQKRFVAFAPCGSFVGDECPKVGAFILKCKPRAEESKGGIFKTWK